MGVTINNSTLSGSYTPICNSCGVCLCWDISEYEYLEYKEFWDNWKCRDCNPKAKGSYNNYKINKLKWTKNK